MSWIRLEDGYSDHDKIVDFAATIGNPLAEAYLTRLWTWACRNRPSGDLSGMKPATIAHIVRFPGEAQELVDALHQCRLLDADWKIHNWHVYQGAIIEKREADRERSRAKWASRPKTNISRDSRETVARESQDSRETVARLSRATVRDGTVRDETKNEVPAPTADAAVPAPEGKPVQEPLIDLPDKPKKPRKLTRPQEEANRWRERALAIQGIPLGEAGDWPQRLYLAFQQACKGRTIETMMKSLDGIARLPPGDFVRRRGWTHWMAAECIDAGLAALGAPIASAGQRGAFPAIPGQGSVREERDYSKPPPPKPALPEWTAEAALARALVQPSFAQKRLTVPFGKSLPDGFQIPDGVEVVYLPDPGPKPLRLQDIVGAP